MSMSVLKSQVYFVSALDAIPVPTKLPIAVSTTPTHVCVRGYVCVRGGGLDLCTYVCMHVCTCMYVWMYVCMYGCMYVCTHECEYVHA